MVVKKYFGTDGIRGKVGKPPIMPDFFLKLGWALGRVLETNSSAKVLIGKDTRISGYMFESALEAGIVAAGVDVHLLGPMPTPAISYLTRTLQFDAGIVISASHNSFHDNGIKFFAPDGGKFSDATEQRIEELMHADMKVVPPASLGKAARTKDAEGRYIEFCKGTFPNYLRARSLTIVLDCANGAGYNVAPCVFRELGATVHCINDKPDGLNINDNCGATQPQALAKHVVEHKADLGIALDGDGDRVIMVDHTGAVVDGDEILCILAHWYQHSQKEVGGVVGTLMSNLGLQQSIEKLGLPFHRTKVGDRYVQEALKARSWLLGGESSGHTICLDLHSTGDGIIVALQVLAAMLSFGSSLYELKLFMQKLPQVLINVPNDGGLNLSDPRVQKLQATAEQKIGATGRVLLRSSGTEPLLRVMTEGEDLELVQLTANFLADELKELACAVI